MRLSEAIELFLSTKTPNTANSYRYVLRDFTRTFVSPERELDTILPLDLIRYMSSVNNREEVVSPATYNKYVKTLRTFFNWCVKTKLVEQSPAAEIKFLRSRKSVPKSKAMPPSILNRLISYAEKYEVVEEDPRPLALIRFLADTGCRTGGAASLTRERLGIHEPVVLNGAKVYVATLFEKGRADPDNYYYSETTAKVLRRWLLHHNGKYVFSLDGKRLKNHDLGQYFRRFCIRAKVGSWGPHSLRHAKGHASAAKHPVSVTARILNDTPEIVSKYYYPKHDDFVRTAAAELFIENNEDSGIIQVTKRTGS